MDVHSYFLFFFKRDLLNVSIFLFIVVIIFRLIQVSICVMRFYSLEWILVGEMGMNLQIFIHVFEALVEC